MKVVLVFIFVLCSVSVFGQSKQISDYDKTQIIAKILRQQDFNDSELCCDKNKKNIVYLLAKNIFAKQITGRKGIKFVLVTTSKVDAMKKTGVEYYSFGKFKIGKSGVQTYLSRTYSNIMTGQGNGHTVEYTCRKVAGKWKVKGRLGVVYAS